MKYVIGLPFQTQQVIDHGKKIASLGFDKTLPC